MHQHAQDRFAAAKRNFMLLASSAVLSLAPPGARAAWSYDFVAKTITDGNWVLNVVSTTVDGVPGLGITGRNNSTGTGDLDLATFATDVGQPIVSVGGFGAGGAIYWLTSFVGPDVRSAGSQCFRYQKSLTNVVLSAEVSTFGTSAFDQTTAIKRFYPKTFPNVTSLNSTFCISSIPGDLVFPNVTTLSGSAVRGSGVTSASFPKCKTISIFSGSSALTNVVFDWPATSIQEASLASCGKLTTEIYLAGGTLTKIPKKAFQSSNAIKGVHIDCPNLLSLEYESFYYAQNIPLYWYSANCPQLAQRALGGNASNPFGIAHLPRIYLMRGPVIDAWAGAYTPIAEVEQTYKNRSDFPGERTLGLLYQAGSTSNNVAWIVDGTPNYGLFVASVPEAVGAPSPTFGEHLGHVATNAVADASGATTIHFNSAIYSNQNYSVETSADKGATWIAPAVTNAGAVYAYPADGFYRVTWLWSPVAYQILGAAPGGGSVAISGTTVEEGYYAAGSSATLTAIPPADQRFERWEGDVATERMYDNPLVVVADAPKSLTAVFADGWILDDGSTTLSNKTWTFTVRSATVGEASGLEIVNVLTAPAAQTTLDFGRVESDTGSRVIKVAASVFSSKTYLGSFLAPDMLAIGNSAFSQASVTNVVVSTNLVAIGQYAFHRATQLAGFWPRTLPGLSTLPSYAFYYTIALGGDFVFPNLTSFGEYAFGGIENTAGPKITSVLATNCTMIGNSSFAFCYYLVEARFSDDLATITAAAFKHDRLLRDFHPMTLPQLTTLGNEAFMYCHHLTGDFVVPILESTGSGCLRSTALSSFTAPSCTNLGSYSFDSCSFQSAKDGSWNRYTSEYYLTNVTVSADVETIGELAMSGCGSLKCFNPTDLRSLTTLSRYAFKGCSALADGHTDFYLPKITVINNEVFYGARATMVHAPLVTSVGDSALRTGYITNAILSRAIGHVGNSAFYYSSQLVTPIYLFSDSLTGIADNAFRSASKTEVHIKAPNLSAMGYEAFCYSPPPIYWYSPIKPGFTFGIRCISSGQPPQSVTTFFRLYLKTTPAVESWGQYYTPVAELDPAYLTRSDYLALKADRKTRNVLGLMKQGTDPDSSYAWIIDAREHTATTLLVR